jgi:hypothetical protein
MNSKMLSCIAYMLIIIFFIIIVWPYIMRRFDKTLEGLTGSREESDDEEITQELRDSEAAQEKIINILKSDQNIQTGGDDIDRDKYIFNLGSTLTSTSKNSINKNAMANVDKLIINSNINIDNLSEILDICGNNAQQVSKLNTLIDTYIDNIKLVGLNILVNYDELSLQPHTLHYYVNKYKDYMLILSDLKAYLNNNQGFHSNGSVGGGTGGGLLGGIMA